MRSVVAVMPCMGRLQQTVDLVPRLLATAGTEDWDLVCVVDGDDRPLTDALLQFVKPYGRVSVKQLAESGGYWKCLEIGSSIFQWPLIANLANDLLPGRNWLLRGLEAYRERFGSGFGIIGFNDGIHEGAHAAHMLSSRVLLKSWFGASLWPLHYNHNFGDTEIVARAVDVGAFAVAPWAVLYHNHPVAGGQMDEVYRRGLETWGRDERKFRMLREGKWTSS